MTNETLLTNIILLTCPRPDEVDISHTSVGTKAFVTIRPSSYNITRLVGRQGATITAIKALAHALAPMTTIALLDAENITARRHPEHPPADVMATIAERLRFSPSEQTTEEGRFVVLPSSLPETLAIAIRTVFRNATRHPLGPIFVQ